MTQEPTNGELYTLIHKLCTKIERLEAKVDRLTKNRGPNISNHRIGNHLDNPEPFKRWISLIKVEMKHYEQLFTLSGGIVTTFKNVIMEHINYSSEIPLSLYNKSIYVYQDQDGSCEWCAFTDNNLGLIIQEVWRKLISIQQRVIHDDPEEDDIKDEKRRVVLQMRKNLFETKKNRYKLLKWLRELI